MKNKIRLFEAFSGYGSQSIALKNIGVNYEVVGISEIDKYALQAYAAIHDDMKNFGDISKIDAVNIPDHDLLTYSFPCQDISVAGKQRGFEVGSGTRSSLLWECQRIIHEKKPKYLLMENVKNLVSKKHKPYFDEWCKWLEKQGYTNYYKCLNSKNFKIPHNRERIYMISILGSHTPYIFPSGYPLKYSLKDIMDSNVDKKYYLANDIQEQFRKTYHNYISSIEKEHPTIEPNLIQIGLLDTKGYEQINRVYSDLGICPTLSTMQGGNTQPKILETQNPYHTIRKLTETECGKLMGLSNEDILKIKRTGLSVSQQYKIYGNSIVIPVLEDIFKNLFL